MNIILVLELFISIKSNKSDFISVINHGIMSSVYAKCFNQFSHFNLVINARWIFYK